MVLRTRVHYSPIQYTTEDPPPSSYGRAILGTHPYLEVFSSFHLLVYELYRQPSSPLPRTRLFERMMLTLQGCTSSYTLSPLTAAYTTCTQQPSSGSPARVSAMAYLNTEVSSPGLSPIQVPSAGSPAEVSTYGPERCEQGPETPNGRPAYPAMVYLPQHSPPLGSALRTAANT